MVVIDDWHRVSDAAAIDALRFLLENGCHHLQIIVTSRSSDGLPMATMRVRNELIEIDSAALRFDVAEANSFLVEASGLALADHEVAALRNCTEGWVAGLQLALLSLRGHHDPAKLISDMSGRHHTIADYLTENVRGVDPTLLEALMETSLPERICGDLASALTGRSRGQALLEEIEQHDLFLSRIDEAGEWFRYHHLFVQFLRQRLERDHPERVAALHRTAAAWLCDHGMLSEAIDHALAGGDDAQAVDLVETHAMDCVQHAQLATLVGLVAKLPSVKIATRPQLLVALAWAHMMLRQPAEMNVMLGLYTRRWRVQSPEPIPTSWPKRLLSPPSPANWQTMWTMWTMRSPIAWPAPTPWLLGSYAPPRTRRSYWRSIGSSSTKHGPGTTGRRRTTSRSAEHSA